MQAPSYRAIKDGNAIIGVVVVMALMTEVWLAVYV